MNNNVSDEPLIFATFYLEDQIELAFPVKRVREATRVADRIIELPTSRDYVQGIMNLRGSVIPIINLKKRLNLSDVTYRDDSRVAIVESNRKHYGILVDCTKDVLSVQKDAFETIGSELQNDDKVICGVIKLDGGQRLLEVVDIDQVFFGLSEDELEIDGHSEECERSRTKRETAHERYLAFSNTDQEFAVDIQSVREIVLLGDIDETYCEKEILGTVRLHGRRLPVIDFRTISDFDADRVDSFSNANKKVLVLQSNSGEFGAIIDSVSEIIDVFSDDILPLPLMNKGTGIGVIHPSEDRNILLIDVQKSFARYADKLKAISSLSNDSIVDTQENSARKTGHNYISNNSYLVFGADRTFAIDTDHVCEILPSIPIIGVPETDAFIRGIINLRGDVLPVLDTRRFFRLSIKKDSETESVNLIIANSQDHSVALLVDEIYSIARCDKHMDVPDLHSPLSDRQSCFKSMIVAAGANGIKDHVLILDLEKILESVYDENRPDIDEETENERIN